ncbi:hypothetical protein JCM14076_17580 [Methylosoma difficile]
MSLLNPVNTSLCLEQVCTSNYQKLLKLIPNLSAFKHAAVGVSRQDAHLYVTVLERSIYTMTIELSHNTVGKAGQTLQPAVKIRLYLDAQLAEVLSDHVRPEVSQVFQNPSLSREIMFYKWRLNYFLQKWLDHCLLKGYQLTDEAVDAENVFAAF